MYCVDCVLCWLLFTVVSNVAGGDQQFLQISFTPATAAYTPVSQSVVLVAPAVGTQQVPVLAAGSQAVVPGSHAWMEVTSLPSVVVKTEKCAGTLSVPSAGSNLANSRYVLLLIITTIPWAVRLRWLENAYSHPLLWQVIFTRKSDLVFGVQSWFISGSVHARWEVCAVVMICATLTLTLCCCVLSVWIVSLPDFWLTFNVIVIMLFSLSSVVFT